ncbi:MAG: hypothetical protein CMJ62_00075 [Planctomycetaceae bacterium]|nr:hypothetical protein [Planctomycetaceae bacterium]
MAKTAFADDWLVRADGSSAARQIFVDTAGAPLLGFGFCLAEEAANTASRVHCLEQQDELRGFKLEALKAEHEAKMQAIQAESNRRLAKIETEHNHGLGILASLQSEVLKMGELQDAKIENVASRTQRLEDTVETLQQQIAVVDKQPPSTVNVFLMKMGYLHQLSKCYII